LGAIGAGFGSAGFASAGSGFSGGGFGVVVSVVEGSAGFGSAGVGSGCFASMAVGSTTLVCSFVAQEQHATTNNTARHRLNLLNDDFILHTLPTKQARTLVFAFAFRSPAYGSHRY
jgi:hypothetical protein